MLNLCPEHREWCLWLPQDQDRSLILKVHTRIAGRPGGQRHRAEPPCSVLGSNIDCDDDLASTPLRSPGIEGVVSADRRGPMTAPTQLHEPTRPALNCSQKRKKPPPTQSQRRHAPPNTT